MAAENSGGELHGHYGVIAPFGDARIGASKNKIVPICMGGHGEMVLHHATIRGVAGQFARHLRGGTVADTRFEDCGIGFAGTYQTVLRGCVFANCRTALTAPTRDPLTLYQCVFQNNTNNWGITYQSIIAIDCEFDALDKGIFKNARSETFFISKRHIVVKVVDGAGKPVRNARVHARPEQTPRAAEFDLEYAVTDADGRTPSLDRPGALLLKEILLAAPEADETAPLRTTYRYTLAAPFQVSRPTIREYLTLLTRIFVLEELLPWHSNRLSRLIKTPKLHLGDTGLACALLGLNAEKLWDDRPIFGRMLATFIVQELRRQGSWQGEPITFSRFRDKEQNEVDIVLESCGRLAGIEVKAGATVTSADFRGLRKLQSAGRDKFAAGVVLYNGQDIAPFGDKLYDVPISILWQR